MGADCRHSTRRPQEIVTAANQVPGLVGVFSLFNTRTPKVYADIDRVRAEMLGVTANRVFETLQVYLGSSASGFSRLKRRRRLAGADDASNGKADRREEAPRQPTRERPRNRGAVRRRSRFRSDPSWPATVFLSSSVFGHRADVAKIAGCKLSIKPQGRGRSGREKSGRKSCSSPPAGPRFTR